MNQIFKQISKLFNHICYIVVFYFIFLISDLYTKTLTENFWSEFFFLIENWKYKLKDLILFFFASLNMCKYSYIYLEISQEFCEKSFIENIFLLHNYFTIFISSFCLLFTDYFLAFKDFYVSNCLIILTIFLTTIFILILLLIDYHKTTYAPILCMRRCQVCLYMEPNIILRPCSHLNICESCLAFQRRITNKCPTCRKTISYYTNVYFY